MCTFYFGHIWPTCPQRVAWLSCLLSFVNFYILNKVFSKTISHLVDMLMGWSSFFSNWKTHYIEISRSQKRHLLFFYVEHLYFQPFWPFFFIHHPHTILFMHYANIFCITLTVFAKTQMTLVRKLNLNINDITLYLKGHSNTIRTLIMHSMAEWYMRGEQHDQNRLSRILDCAQDLKVGMICTGHHMKYQKFWCNFWIFHMLSRLCYAFSRKMHSLIFQYSI